MVPIGLFLVGGTMISSFVFQFVCTRGVWVVWVDLDVSVCVHSCIFAFGILHVSIEKQNKLLWFVV